MRGSKSTKDDRLWCAHTLRFSSIRRLCVQQKTKIAWCVPGLTLQTEHYAAYHMEECTIEQYNIGEMVVIGLLPEADGLKGHCIEFGVV